MPSRGVRGQWEKEVDETSFLYDSNAHYALYGPELMRWHLHAVAWAYRVFKRDVRDIKAVLRFVAVFLAHMETGKRLIDGRPYALISENRLVSVLGGSKETAKAMIARVTLTKAYADLRVQYAPIVEVVEETRAGARAGLWGTGYAPIMPDGMGGQSGTVSNRDKRPGTDFAGDTVPDELAAGTVSPRPGTVISDPGTVSRAPGTAVSVDAVPSVPSYQSPPSLKSADLPGYRDFVAVFPMSPGRREQETRRAFDEWLRVGYSAEQLIEGAQKQISNVPKEQQPRFPLHFLSNPEAVRAWCGIPPKRFAASKLVDLGDGMFCYPFDGVTMDYVDCPSGSSRDVAIKVALEEFRRRWQGDCVVADCG